MASLLCEKKREKERKTKLALRKKNWLEPARVRKLSESLRLLALLAGLTRGAGSARVSPPRVRRHTRLKQWQLNNVSPSRNGALSPCGIGVRRQTCNCVCLCDEGRPCSDCSACVRLGEQTCAWTTVPFAETTLWNFASSARQTSSRQLRKSVTWLGGFATMHSISTASHAGCSNGAFARSIIPSGTFSGSARRALARRELPPPAKGEPARNAKRATAPRRARVHAAR